MTQGGEDGVLPWASIVTLGEYVNKSKREMCGDFTTFSL